MQNQVRNYVKIIKDICEKNDINIESFSYDWIFKLRKNNMINYIIGYQFGLNAGSVQTICTDKSALSDILIYGNIPTVEHYFFMSPINQKYVSPKGNWKEISALLEKHKEIVCKTNNGTGGKNIYHVTNEFELEKAVFKIFKKSRSMAISPYYDIENEYRLIVLNGKIKLVYSKNRPYIKGDGNRSIKELYIQYLENNDYMELTITNDESNVILESGEVFNLSWKHNLGTGAIAKIVDDAKIINDLNNIAQKATELLNLSFVSIDIIHTKNEYRILEINSGVMMEYISQQSSELYTIVENIYEEAILEMLKYRNLF